jgi:hypothetical protein
MATRPARFEDIDEIAMGLPEVEFGISWGDRPTYKVDGKGFLLFRAPRTDCLDPQTGEPMDDVIVIQVADGAAKAALVGDESPFFTIPHFDRTTAVLVRRRDLHLLDREELAEIITEAWLKRAPKRLAKSLDG